MIALTLAACYLLFFLLFPLARGAIYEPSTREQTDRIAEAAAVGPGDRAADLGSGDGRVLIALAERGAEAHGYEINPILVLLSRRNIRKAGLAGRAVVHWKSFWRADISRFDAVTVYQASYVMRRLEAKVRKELREGARVVSDYWGFPTLAPEARLGTLSRYRMSRGPASADRGGR